MRKGYLKIKEIKTSERNYPAMQFVETLTGAYISLNKEAFKIQLNHIEVNCIISDFKSGIFTDTYFFEANGYKLRIVLPAEMIQTLNPNAASVFTIASIEHDKFAIVFELIDKPSLDNIPEMTVTNPNPLKIYQDDTFQYIPLPDISNKFEEYMRVINYFIFDHKYHVNSKMYLPAMAYVAIDFLVQCRTNYSQNMIPEQLVKQVQQFTLNAFQTIYMDAAASKEFETLLSNYLIDANLYKNFKFFVEKYNMQKLYPFYNTYA